MRKIGAESSVGQLLAKMSCFRTNRTFVYSKLAQDENDNDDVIFVADTHADIEDFTPTDPQAHHYDAFNKGRFFSPLDDDDVTLLDSR